MRQYDPVRHPRRPRSGRATTASDQPRNILRADQHEQDDNEHPDASSSLHGDRILLLDGTYKLYDTPTPETVKNTRIITISGVCVGSPYK